MLFFPDFNLLIFYSPVQTNLFPLLRILDNVWLSYIELLNYLEESDKTECRKRELFQMKTSADTVQDLDDIISSEWDWNEK